MLFWICPCTGCLECDLNSSSNTVFPDSQSNTLPMICCLSALTKTNSVKFKVLPGFQCTHSLFYPLTKKKSTFNIRNGVLIGLEASLSIFLIKPVCNISSHHREQCNNEKVQRLPKQYIQQETKPFLKPKCMELRTMTITWHVSQQVLSCLLLSILTPAPFFFKYSASKVLISPSTDFQHPKYYHLKYNVEQEGIWF